MLRSIRVNSPGSPWSQSGRRRRLRLKGFVKKEGFKLGVKQRGVMDDESGESMEEKLSVTGTGETTLHL